MKCIHGWGIHIDFQTDFNNLPRLQCLNHVRLRWNTLRSQWFSHTLHLPKWFPPLLGTEHQTTVSCHLHAIQIHKQVDTRDDWCMLSSSNRQYNKLCTDATLILICMVVILKDQLTLIRSGWGFLAPASWLLSINM